MPEQAPEAEPVAEAEPVPEAAQATKTAQATKAERTAEPAAGPAGEESPAHQEHEGDPAALLAAIGGLGPLARRLNQAHTRLWYEQVHQDLTGPQFTVLSLLHTRGPLDQGTLSALTHLDKSTTTPLLERLRGRGLLDISRDTADRRRKLIRITPEGRDLATHLAPTVTSISEQLLDPLTPEEQTTLLTLLRRTVEEAQG